VTRARAQSASGAPEPVIRSVPIVCPALRASFYLRCNEASMAKQNPILERSPRQGNRLVGRS
jgi:hypothetical protein